MEKSKVNGTELDVLDNKANGAELDVTDQPVAPPPITEVIGSLLESIANGRMAAVDVYPDSNGGLAIIVRPYLTSIEVRSYLGGMSPQYFREFCRECLPCRTRPRRLAYRRLEAISLGA